MVNKHTGRQSMLVSIVFVVSVSIGQ